MADIRKSTVILDNFTRADENPVAAPWFNPGAPVTANMKIGANRLGGTATAPKASMAYYSVTAYDNDDAEMWACAGGSPALTEGWRFGLFREPGIATVDGYEILPHNGIGPDRWSMRRITNGGYITLASVIHPALPAMMLMRRNGANVEGWESFDSGANWTLIISVADTMHTTGLYPFLGVTGTTTGWTCFGAGPLIAAPIVGMNWREAERHVSATRALLNPSDQAF